MKLNELFNQFRNFNEDQEPNFKEILRVFLPFAQKIIELDKLPKIILKKTLGHAEQPTMGRFYNDTYTLELAVANRQPVDILRTLAHELVHAKQHSDHIDIDPTTGSPEENDANVLAGIVMRKFNKAHPEFLRLKPISEGGNLSLDNPTDAANPYQADEIDLQVHKRSYIVPILDKLLHDINSAFYAQTKKPIWNPQLLQSKEFLGGSSLHFFNTTGITDREFAKHKPKVGDIDTQCNKELEPEVHAFLSSMNHKKIGDAIFLGFSQGNEQYNGLFQFEDPPMKIQIDFEFGKYNTETDSPDEWFRFSHSTEWNDIQAGVKGVFHKYLYRALTSAHGSIKHQVNVLKTKTNITPHVHDNDVSFAVASGQGGGLSHKYEPYIHTDPTTGEKKTHDQDVPYKRLLPSSERKYIQQLDQQFYYLFGHHPENNDSQLQKSFLGTLELINKYLEPDTIVKVFESFVDICFEPGSQMITKDDPKRDREIKFAAIDKFIETCNLQKQRKAAVDKAQHYADDFLDLKAFKEKNPPQPGGKKPMYGKLRKAAIAAGTWKPISEAIGEASEEHPAVKSQLRRGMPHLRDLKSADFLDLLDELHQGNGQFQLKNIPLNVKVDGFGGRFGKNADGKPFMGTSRTEPRYKAEFLDYHKKKGTTDPDVLGRAKMFDNLFDEMMKVVQLVDSKLGANFLINKQITCEVLYLPFATQTPEGKLKFVGIHYDKLPKGVQLALVPFRVVEADSGEDLPNSSKYIKKLLSVGTAGSVMFIDNSLTQNEALDVTAIVPPLENIEQLKAMLSSRKRDQAAKVKSALEPIKLALEDAIIKDPNIIGKDLLGKEYEGIVINSRLGPIKITSAEQKKVIADKNATTVATRTEHFREGTNKTAVVAIGSFVGHIGHEQLFNYTVKKAKQVGGDPYLFIGNAVGKDDPIPVKTKLETWHKLYPNYAKHISAVTQEGGSLMQKIKHELINPLPGKSPRYDNIIIMVGEDQAGMNLAHALMKAVNKFQGYEHVKVSLEATSRGTGVSFSQLRNILKDPKATPQEQLAVWSKGFDVKKLGTPWIKHLMDVTKQGMGIHLPAKKKSSPQQRASAPVETMAGVGMGNYVVDKNISERLTHNSYRNIPLEPIWEQQEEDIRQEILKNPKLFENTADYKSLQNFLRLHKTNNYTVGKSYVYVSIISWIPGNIISLAHFSKPYKLVKLENNRAYFDVNGKIKQYPEGVTDDLLKTTFMFSNMQEFSKFQTMLGLKFSDWRLTTKVITHDTVESTTPKNTTKQRLDPKCWKGYKKQGTKIKGRTRVNKCVKIGEVYENKIASLIEQLKKK